jgi:hypothetical protein
MKISITLYTYRLFFLLLFMIFIISKVSAQDPQVLRVSQIKEDRRLTKTLQRNGDHFYVILEQRYNDASSRDLTDDLEIDSFVHHAIPNSEGVVELADISKVILDYKIGEGFVDYDYISNANSLSAAQKKVGDYYKNDSIVAMAVLSNHCTWNGKTYVPEVLPDTAKYGFYITVIDYVKDSVMFSTKASAESRIDVDMLTVSGDDLYVVTRTNEDTFEFMGEFFPEVIDPNWNVKHIHKINWKTGIKEWSRQFSTDIDIDYVQDLKVVEGGNLIIAGHMYGRTHWDGVPIPGNSVYDGGFAFFKISPDGELLDYIQSACDCTGFIRVHIEPDGSLMLFGGQSNMPNLTLGDFELEMNPGLLTGIYGFVPADWNDPWIKAYPSEYPTVVFGGSQLLYDKTKIAILGFYDNIEIDGYKFTTEDQGLFENPMDGKLETILASYDSEGTLVQEPISLPLDARLYEIHEVGENHYLFYMQERKHEVSTLYGTQIGTYLSSNFILFEIEGNLFDIVNNLDDLISPYMNELNVYPNPVSATEEITVEYDEIIPEISSIRLSTLSGEFISLIDYQLNDNNIKLQLPSIPSGIYLLHVLEGKKSSHTKLYIK